LDGLVIEGDLRWNLVISLAAAGRLTEADIATEAAADTTVDGASHAAEARASMPTPKRSRPRGASSPTTSRRPRFQLAAADGFRGVPDR